jgi:hypothetical protein
MYGGGHKIYLGDEVGRNTNDQLFLNAIWSSDARSLDIGCTTHHKWLVASRKKFSATRSKYSSGDIGNKQKNLDKIGIILVWAPVRQKLRTLVYCSRRPLQRRRRVAKMKTGVSR